MDLEAFETRIVPSKNKLFRFALRILGDVDEAQDVVQDVLIKVWNGRSNMNAIGNWEAWCMRLTKNLSLDRLRARQRKATHSITEGLEIKQEELSPHEHTELIENMKYINKLISALPEKQRLVMHLRDVEGLSYKEISETLELDMNQVKINLFRARNAVREKLVKMNAYGL